MKRTIFILGTDPEYCAKLQNALQARFPDSIVIVTPFTPDTLTSVGESDTIILSGKESIDVLFAHVLRLQRRAKRATILGDLIRSSVTPLSVEEMLEHVVVKSTEVLGGTSLIVLASNDRYQVGAVFSTDAEQLKRMLMTAINRSPQTAARDLLCDTLDRGEPLVIPNLRHVTLAPELQFFVEKYDLLSLIATPIRGKNNQILGAFISISNPPNLLNAQDVSAATELADFSAMFIENARSATTDTLTEAHNNRFFVEALKRETARADRYGTPLSLLMIDIDSFKFVNDNFGHLVGNGVLTQIAKIFTHAVRTTDFVCRCGGDEFGVVLPGTNAKGALPAAKKILERVQSGSILESLGHSGAATVSIGIAEHRRGEQPETLVGHADQALLLAKRAGKNTIHTYGEDEEDPGKT